MQLSERLLNDAGGWQAMKHARSLHAAGRVTEPSWSEEVLSGFVREGETRYKSGLRFISRTNIDSPGNAIEPALLRLIKNAC